MAVRKQVFADREAWLKARQQRIGGSDAGACVGMNAHKDNIQLWEEKMGLTLPEDISDRPYVRYGIRMEPLLREMFVLDFPQYQVSYDEFNMFTNTEYPWMHASLDGELVDKDGRRGILEIKTTEILQNSQWEQWNHRLPGSYYCQVLHYLAVTGYDFAVLKARIRSRRGEELAVEERHYFLERKDLEEDMRYLAEAERRLWDCITSGRRPDLVLPAI